MKKIALLLSIAFLTYSCNDDDDSISTSTISINFTQNWDGNAINQADLSTTVYTNQKGHELQIDRLRYLLSNIELTNTAGETTRISDYQLIDISDASSLTIETTTTLPEGNYTLSFVHGFTEEDNIDGEYNDLNVAGWSWPEALGGGYHFMQFDGNYNVNTTPAPFNYHNGTAKVSDGEFEQNFVSITIDNTLSIQGNNTIDIQMNVAEWFKNPYTWDLDVYNTPLMPNYDAQKLMQQNAATVYSASTN